VSGPDFSALPSVHSLVSHEELSAFSSPLRLLATRELIAESKSAIIAAHRQGLAPPEVDITVAQVTARIARILAPPMVPVINATGVVLHTNLGRAPLSASAIEHMTLVARGYCNLEYDITAGGRGSRQSHAAQLLTLLTGAEAAVIANNNAAATVLGIAALAAGREVVVSRSELIEIGGSFRLPEILSMAGAKMVACGTTNKTRIDDYRRAIGPATALLLKVHPANFEMTGFVQQVSVEELSALGKACSIATMIDAGSGCLYPASVQHPWVDVSEPVIPALVGLVDAISFSADKLLGGPQAGILIGKQSLIATAKKHPWMRALRPDKLTLAALTATLTEHLQRGGAQLPTIAMLDMPIEQLQLRADRVLQSLRDHCHPQQWTLSIEPSIAMVGAGSLPSAQLPSVALVVRQCGPHASLQMLVDEMRRSEPAVVARIQDDALFLDMRTILPADELPLACSVVSAWQRLSAG
jgi:L-seryl-tRNA(Ser) seleniumtransferase